MKNGRNAALNGGRGSGQTVRRITEIYEEKIADLKANFDYILEGKENEYREERKKLCDDFENMKAGLESQIATLGERCNQLLKDKGDLTDRNKQLELIILGNQEEITGLEQELQDCKEKLAQTIENDEVAYETLKLHDQEEIGMLKSRVAELEQELQDLKDRHAEEVELHLHAEDYIKSLEQQIEKFKTDIKQAIDDADRWEETETFSVLNRIYNDNFEITKGV